GAAGSYLNNTGNGTTTIAGTIAGASATLTVLARPTIAKSFSPNPVGIVSASVLTITLTNANAVAITGAAFTDTYPAGLANTAAPRSEERRVGKESTANNGPSHSHSDGTIPASGSWTVTANVTSAAAGSNNNPNAT